MFRYKYEVVYFLRIFTKSSFQFYEQFQDELILVFKTYNFSIEPPLKLNPSGDAFDNAREVNDFLGRRIKSFRKLTEMRQFRGMFCLSMNIKVSEFDLERDLLNIDMFLPTSQILFDENTEFDSITFTFGTKDNYRLNLVTETRMKLMPNYVEEFLLCNHDKAFEAICAKRNIAQLPQISTQKLILSRIDLNILPHFTGFFHK